MSTPSLVSLVEEWIGWLGTSLDEAILAEWFAERETGDLIRGRAQDARVGLLQLDASGSVLSRVYLDLATPSPVGALEESYGPGHRSYAVDATYEAVTWNVRRAAGDVLVTADCSPDGLLLRISLLPLTATAP